MRILKYTFDFDPQKESPIVPMWIALPKLPLVFYDKAILFSIASVIGTPLKLDESAAKKSRTNLARICVEMDINAPRLDRIRIGNEDFAIWQNIYYEDLPLYCSFCQHLGHEIERCFWKNTTGSKARTHMEDEGDKTMQDKKKGKAVWVEKHSGEFSVEEEGIGEIGECSKGNTELLEETKKYDRQIQLEATKEEEVINSAKEFPEQVVQITEEPHSAVNQEDHHTGYFDCLKEKVEEKSDLFLINHEFQMSEEIKSGDILIDQIFVDMGKWKNMDKVETAQDRAEIDKSLSDTEEQFISFKTTWLEVENTITAVYAKCSVNIRRELWSALIQSAEKLDMPWLIGGDFNAILNRDERVGGNSPDRRSMEDFSSMILECGVEEVNCNSQFTWSNGIMWEKLDRILVNYQWSAAYDGFKTEALNRDTSDHCPILLHCSPLSTTPKSSFRFQSMWCQHDKLLEMIKQNWDTPLSPYSKGLFGFFYKLKWLKSALKRWNKEVFGNIFDEIQKAEKEALDKERHYDTLQSPEARTEVNRSYANLNKLLSQEEAFWRQKSGIKWLREGDKNSKFFHAVVKKNRSKNKISQIRDSEGRLILNEAEIQNSAMAYFQSILTKESTEDGRDLLESIPNIISLEDNRILNAVPTAEEIKGTVFSFDKDSAAGPDGFSALFYQHCWDIIQHDLCEAIVDFFDGKIIPTGIAATSIVLIPKKKMLRNGKIFVP
ncbi:DNAse I-like superfamily protein [Abeliophyllum distichum]|uniref:DNAse I-like superfamily protein n=1 Tax=Abeliophyllum distichum TaxID=126358 RepID=A0ABD1Q4T0_9LAMI